MLSIAVCDDNRLHGERTARIIQAHSVQQQMEVLVFETPDALLSAIETEGYYPRIAVLDIRMEEMSGIQLAQALNERLPQCAIIFLTAYLEYATEVYETAHVYFILKSELEQRIGAALEKALTADAEEPMLFYRTGTAVKAVPCRQVVYLERILHKTRIRRVDMEEWTNLSPSDLLSGVGGISFIRCHQSYWVNFQHIKTMESEEFILYNDTRLPISRTYRKQAKEQFFQCIRSGQGRTAQ